MDFTTVCQHLGIGAPLADPIPLSGGFLHRMVRLTTATGDYAVKVLNPTIMARPTAIANFRTAEALERQLEQANLPILPALTIHGEKMQQVEGRYYYLFPYYPGAALSDGAITPTHCAIVGTLLARIHGVTYRDIPCRREPLAIDWDAYRTTELAPLLEEHRSLLTTLQQQGNQALPHLPTGQTICHNDMDPKNVLWQGEDCRIIDLECLSYDSPYLELLETALCWAGYESGQTDLRRLTAFITGYAQGGGTLPTDWDTLYAANRGRLDWLSYNLDRALSDNPADRAIGLSEVGKTLTCLKGYAQNKKAVLETLYAATKTAKR